MGVFPETIIASGVVSPISMPPFPAMETCQPVRPGNQPDITRPQIEILVPHHTDVFDPIPSVSLGHHGGFNHHCWRHHHGWRKCNCWYHQPHLPIRLYDTPGQES